MSGSPELRIALAQQDFPVGDVGGNTDKIIAVLRQVRQAQSAHLVVFPELAMCGYPPEDLLFHAGLKRQVAEGLERVCNESREVAVLVGYPEYADQRIYNSVALFAGGRQIANYRKCCLPNYSVFDEQRYFTPGGEPVVAEFRGFKLGLGICEDIWQPGLPARARAAGADLLLVINGSPFEMGKQAQREAVITARAAETGCPLVYLNLVGGQDELVFDGGSCVADAEGRIVFRAPAFAAGLHLLGFRRERDGQVVPEAGTVVPLLDDVASVYAALLAGIRDYVRKNGFPGVVLGLSGGIDSALTLALAVDALGAMAVQAVMMPYRYTAAMSIEDAALQAQQMGVDYQVLPIEAMVSATRDSLAALFAGLPEDATEENIQSRCRGILLMAISNKTGRMVLATGNKSEMAVGYATLYGDMAGGFAPIKDCTKTLVYQLARYRNGISPVIPERVIDRPPSAELRPDQQDSDSLPPYPVLDAILDALIIDNRSVDEIAAHGFDREVTGRVLEMVRRAEYKRRQAPPGVRITGRAFGRDWRYPITSGYRHKA
ncbi:MAG: NAD+ synthase [Gammaproteobacteria bacterium]